MTNMNKKLTALSVLASLSVLTACSSAPAQDRTPYLDSQFGNAVNMAKAQQTLNPNASQNRDTVAGIDGRAAREAVERYESTFQKPQPQPNVFGIGVGGSGGQ
jgi:hypothetical protein